MLIGCAFRMNPQFFPSALLYLAYPGCVNLGEKKEQDGNAEEFFNMEKWHLQRLLRSSANSKGGLAVEEERSNKAIAGFY